MSVSSTVSSTSTTLASIVEVAIKHAKTPAELAVYSKMIDDQSDALVDALDADAIAVVRINVIKLLPGYEGAITSLHRHKQSITCGNPLRAIVDSIPVYLSWAYNGDLAISLAWPQHNNACLTFGREQCVSTRDAMIAFPTRVINFAHTMHKANMNLDKEVKYAAKKSTNK
jgi:hypothetical protein